MKRTLKKGKKGKQRDKSENIGEKDKKTKGKKEETEKGKKA